MQVSIYFSSVLILWVYELLLSRAIISRPLRSNTFARQRQMLPRHWHFMSSLGPRSLIATWTCNLNLFVFNGILAPWWSLGKPQDWLTDSPPMSIGVASGHAMVFNDLANLPNTKCGLLLFTLAKHRRQQSEVFCLLSSAHACHACHAWCVGETGNRAWHLSSRAIVEGKQP